MPDRLPGFMQATVLDLGPGAVERLGATCHRLGSARPGLLIDAALLDHDIGDRLRRLLPEAVLVPRASAEPSFSTVRETADRLAGEGVDGIVAVGGGSTLDTGKLARALLATGVGSLRDLPARIPAGTPLITVPTTAGTGAEAGSGAIVYDPQADDKILVRRPGMAAEVAICDGDLTLGLPPHLTAHTGLDALAQAILAYVPATGDSISGQVALQAIRLILRHLPVAVREGGNRAARAGMMQGSVMSALAMFNAPPTYAAEHAFAEPVGAVTGIPHGHCVAAFLVPVAEYNAEALADRYAEIAREVGAADPDTGDGAASRRLVEHLHELVRCLEVAPLRAVARSWDEAVLAERVRTNEGFALNPRPFTPEAVSAILRGAHDGTFRL